MKLLNFPRNPNITFVSIANTPLMDTTAIVPQITETNKNY